MFKLGSKNCKENKALVCESICEELCFCLSVEAETLTIFLWGESPKWKQNPHGWRTGWFQRVHKQWKGDTGIEQMLH